MNKTNFNILKYKKVHLIGFNSPFSQFVAHKLQEQNISFTASDNSLNEEVSYRWRNENVFLGKNSSENITQETDLVIYPNGVLPTNVEYAKALELKIDVVSLPFAVGYFARSYKVIAIAGTHGKSTTTALITWIISQCEVAPNFIFGDANDKIFGIDKNFHLNPASPYLVMEACEYKEQFLDRVPEPFISVVTHIDIDHTDYYTSQQMYNEAFVKFLKNTTHAVIIDKTNTNEEYVVDKLSKIRKDLRFVTPGENLEDDYNLTNKNLLGQKNYQNFLRAFEVGMLLGYEKQNILNAVNNFQGLKFRFEYIGKFDSGADVYRDYAHNPAKLNSLLETAVESNKGKKILLFWQPHNHERTYTFQNEFVEVLQKANLIIVPNIFSTRETEEEKKLITAEDIVKKINDFDGTKKTIYTNDSGLYTESFEMIRKLTDKNWVVVIASAGDLVKVAIPFLQSEKITASVSN